MFSFTRYCSCFLFLFSLLSFIPSLSQNISVPVLTKNNALILQVEKNGDVRLVYFGRKLVNEGEYSLVTGAYRQSEDYTGQLNSVYSTAGSRNLFEPAITVTHADGNNSLDLQY